MKAMLLAAGFGTRLKPFTDNHPKALAEVNGKSLLQRNIEYLQQFGMYDVIINLHHFAEQIIQSIHDNNGWGSNITFSDETDSILETGGGLKRAAWYFNNEEDLVLMNADILTDLPLNEMISFHKKNKPLATLATTNRETSRYFLFNEEDILCGWKNEKTDEIKIPISPFSIHGEGLGLRAKAFSGIHIISTEIFSLMLQNETKFSMVDVYLSLCAEYKILSFDHSGTKFIDVGKPESLRQASLIFNNDFK
ncbi:MAG: sugar phosphate nucleotidyltransferase [Parafilimonas sp.]